MEKFIMYNVLLSKIGASRKSPIDDMLRLGVLRSSFVGRNKVNLESAIPAIMNWNLLKLIPSPDSFPYMVLQVLLDAYNPIEKHKAEEAKAENIIHGY